jgi:hypothetical protein
LNLAANHSDWKKGPLTFKAYTAKGPTCLLLPGFSDLEVENKCE